MATRFLHHQDDNTARTGTVSVLENKNTNECDGCITGERGFGAEGRVLLMLELDQVCQI